MRSLSGVLLGAVVTSLIGSAGGCTRDPLPEFCPDVAEGELVISELRGDQGEADSFGHYIEIYNASDHRVDLLGLRVTQRETGAKAFSMFIRESIDLDAGEYLVIGPGFFEDKKSWVDYAPGWDIPGGKPIDLDEGQIMEEASSTLIRYDSMTVEIEACGELVDEVGVNLDRLVEGDELTRAGTAACVDAAGLPSAEDNDRLGQGCWCVDSAEGEGEHAGKLGQPGTPGGANRCD